MTIPPPPEWLVSLDLEMTGIDPDSDDIIEVGAVRYSLIDGRTQRFETLVNPGRSVPHRIRTLTGISDDDLQSAPPYAMVDDELRSFLGAYPVVGQHVAFDLKYLARNGLLPAGPVYNTAEIAELLLPGLPEYNLRSLTRRFGVDFPVQHRALPDAEAALAVFLKLREVAAGLDPAVLQEIVLLTQGSSWPLRFFFQEVARSLPMPVNGASTSGIALDVLPQPKSTTASLIPLAKRKHVAADEVAEIFDAVTQHPDAYRGFEQRPQQVEMAEAVATALDEDAHLLVEAGTGTGKSLAYLLPAACFALRNNERVVVSTSTINLQGQILGKDVPSLRGLLERCGPADVRAALPELRAETLKGRANYICLQKFANFRRQGEWSTDEARFAAKILLWLQTTGSGDRAELILRREEEALWSRISAAQSDCFAGPSYYVRNGTCQLLRARKRAESAHLVVVNHALLLSDIAAGGKVLPSYDRLIVDEAHNLEDEATNQFGFFTGQTELRNFLLSLHDRAADREQGIVAEVRSALRADPAQPEQTAFVADLVTTLAEITARARERLPELFARLQGFVAAHGESGGEYDQRLLLTPGKRAQPEWQSVELAWENLHVALQLVEDALSRLGVALSDNAFVLNAEGLAAQVANLQQDLGRLNRGVEAVLAHHDRDRIAWLTVNRQFGTVSLSSAPLHVGEVLESYLFGRKSTVVLTSATLSTSGSFRYVRERLGLDEVAELQVGSPFDYQKAALVLTPGDVPEPNRLDFQRALEQAIVDLVRASEGRALVLFTSHAAVRATYRAIKPALETDGIHVLGQGLDGSPGDLLDALRNDFRTVLLGTSSFWEGVDITGEALSLLIIAKLPFSVPNDPIFAARSELFDNPFKQFALPQAVLRFKQGFGRLIRHRGDRGVLVVLDRRIKSKSYGRTFIQSLPPCTVNDAPLSQGPALVRKWLRARAG